MALKRLSWVATAIVGFSLGLAATASAAGYKVIDLGAVPGASGSTAFEVNNLGQVIGYNRTYGSESYFFWSSSTGLINYTGHGTLTALNNNGQVLLNDYPNYALWSPLSGSTVAITSGNGPIIKALNDVGGFAGSVGAGPAAWIGGTPLSGTSPTVIRPAGAYMSPANQAVAINNAGAFVGNIFLGGHADWRDDKFHPFIWTAGQGFQDLGTLASVDGDTTATEMNEAGAVVGYGSQIGTSRVRSFLWTSNAGMQDLGTPYAPTGMSWLDDRASIKALDVNNAGTVIGFSQLTYTSAPDAFLWSAATGNIMLDSLLTDDAKQAGWHISYAASINERGWIAGSAVVGGVSHAVLLVPVPVPEPATWAYMLTGGIAIFGMCRKRVQRTA